MESLAEYFKPSETIDKEPLVTPKEFIEGLLNDFKDTPIELYLYLIPVPVFIYLTSSLPKSINVFTNVVVVGLYTNYTFKTFK